MFVVIFSNFYQRQLFSTESTSLELNIRSSQNIFKSNVSAKSSNKKSDDVFKSKKLIHVPKFMLDLYERNRIGGFDKERPDIVRSLIPSHAEQNEHNEVYAELSQKNILIFEIPSSNDDEQFISAELKILTLLDVDIIDETGVKRIFHISIYDDSIKKLLYFQETQIQHVNNTWVSYDITSAVNDILQTPSKSKVLKIDITISAFLPDIHDSLKLSLMPLEEDFEHDYPVLLLSYTTKTEENNTGMNKGNSVDINLHETRIKRSVEDDYEEETNKLWDDEIYNRIVQIRKIKRGRNNCRKKPLYIDFAEIKYDVWIIQPSGYDAYQCQGRCFYPVAEHLNPTKHAIVQALLHSVAPSKVSRSCCVPTILDPISILYVDTNGILTYRYSYRDMVVAECGCR